MTLETEVKVAVYRATAERGHPPSADDVAARVGASRDEVRLAFASLARSRLLVLEPDELTIRMAPPFSGVPTQHRVHSGGVDYYANCAWDALGIPAALHRPAEVTSRCEESLTPLHLRVGLEGPEASPWLFHCPIPSARWWEDVVHT